MKNPLNGLLSLIGTLPIKSSTIRFIKFWKHSCRIDHFSPVTKGILHYETSNLALHLDKPQIRILEWIIILQGGNDMETTELIMRVEHPPHIRKKGNGVFLPCIIFKIILVFVIFALSFQFRHLTPGFKHRQQTVQGWSGLLQLFQSLTPGIQKKQQMIQEILTILDRQQTGFANVTKEELAEVIYEESVRHHHDPKFILALISIESSFQNWSVSERGAKGLMQIMPYVAKSLAEEMGIEWSGDRTLFNPFLNIRLGIHYLSQLIVDFEDLGLALTAYNYGPTYVKGLVEKKKRIPLHFYRKLLDVYQTF